tara:strand:- start:1184 stop:2191 length:1008 start_codon:yes stop_codon:yes gene_type:complete
VGFSGRNVEVRDVYQLLAEELRKKPTSSKGHAVLLLMAEDKIKALDSGRDEALAYERATLMAHFVDAKSRTTQSPARWLPANTLEKYLEDRMDELSSRLRAAGLTSRPVIRTDNALGGAGKQRTYWLDVEPLPAEELEDSETPELGTQIRYQRSPAGEVKPSWLFRQIFNQGELKNRSHRGYWLLACITLTMAVLAFWVLLGLFGASRSSSGITLGQLLNITLVAGGAWMIWTQLCQPWIQLVDHRVVKAPLLTIHWTEQSAELEMHRDNEGNQWTRFVRFTADCPICSGRVMLMSGKPEHRLPLVGRCVESPYSHVFSFDRALLDGGYIGPGKG